MVLSVQQESDLLMKYAPMAKCLIRRYCEACGLDVNALGDDLLQEAYIEMLLHIRKVESEDMIPLVKLRIMGAMFSMLRRMHAVSMPKHAYKTLRNEYRNEPYDETMLGPDPWAEDDMEFHATFSLFLDGLNETERFVIEKKLEDCPHRELVSHCGIRNEMMVSRILQRLRDELKGMLIPH